MIKHLSGFKNLLQSRTSLLYFVFNKENEQIPNLHVQLKDKSPNCMYNLRVPEKTNCAGGRGERVAAN